MFSVPGYTMRYLNRFLRNNKKIFGSRSMKWTGGKQMGSPFVFALRTDFWWLWLSDFIVFQKRLLILQYNLMYSIYNMVDKYFTSLFFIYIYIYIYIYFVFFLDQLRLRTMIHFARTCRCRVKLHLILLPWWMSSRTASSRLPSPRFLERCHKNVKKIGDSTGEGWLGWLYGGRD